MIAPRILRAVLLAGALLVLTATPAFADPPGPTNYRTELGQLDPPVAGVEARVIGGDAFLQLSVVGHEVVVPGYDGEERYLRFDPNGEVYENRASRAYFQNQARYSVLERAIPDDVGAQAPPEWVLVSTDGTFAWHDHRIHFMSPSTLPNLATDDGTSRRVDPDGGEQLTTVFAEPIPILVDGEPVGIPGDLYYLPDASPLPAILAAVGAFGLVVVLGLRAPGAAVLTGLLTAGVAAVAVGIPQVVGLAAGVASQPLQVVLPLVALGVTLALWSVRSRSTFGLMLVSGGAVPLLVWALTNTDVLTAPIVPPEAVPAILSRIVLGLVVGASIGAIATAVRDLLGSDTLSLDPAALEA